MPRFAPFASPDREEPPPFSPSPQNNTSVRLSCLSPDGRSVYSLDNQYGDVFIETHRLPLEGTSVDADDSAGFGKIRTRLPGHVATALNRYPALELMCVDVDNTSNVASANSRIKLPKLCLYTKRDVFLLDLAYDTYDNATNQVEGTCVSVIEPFERVLLGTSLSTEIIRIRPAPQRYMGYLMMCPPSSMVMLMHCSETFQTSVTLYHGREGEVTRPLSFGSEELDDPSERFTDFCFLNCPKSWQVLSNLSVAIVKGSGDVFVAGPILFLGTVIPKNSLSETLEYLDLLLTNKSSDSAQWRQIKVAKQYLIDCFPMSNAMNNALLTAQARSQAFEWPIQLQGPALEIAESDDFKTLATSIQLFPSPGELLGLAIGHVGGIVEFGLLSPVTSLLPRFQWELPDDSQQLDGCLQVGAIVTRVDLRDEKTDLHGTNSTNNFLTLIPDPIMDSVLHCVTSSQIQSISTNTLKITANKLRQQVFPSPGNMFSPSRRKDLTPKTTAWSCLDISSLEQKNISVVGAVVSGDVRLGHVLVTRLSNGSMVAVNLTETRQLQEMEALGDIETSTSNTSFDNSKVKELEDISPLHEIVEPLAEKIVKGLDGLAMVVGSSTPVSKVTPDQLAAATSIKQRCDDEIVMPILEMREHLKARKKLLAVMYGNQIAQVKTLQDTVSKLKERTSLIQEKASVVQDNSTCLSQRSAAALQSSQDLLPTITQAEFDYFQHLQKLDAKTLQWVGEFESLQGQVRDIQHSVIDADSPIDNGEFEVPLEMRSNINKIFKACDEYLVEYKRKLESAEEKVEDLAAVVGMEQDSEY